VTRLTAGVPPRILVMLAALLALLIGVSEAVAGLLLEPSLKSMFSFGLLIVVLLLRPQGLFGRKETR